MKTKFALIAAALIVVFAMLVAPIAVFAAPPVPTPPTHPAVSPKVEAEVLQLLKSKAETGIKGGGGYWGCDISWVAIQVPASPWMVGKTMSVFVTPTIIPGDYCEPEILLRTEEQVYHNPAPSSGNARMIELTWNTPGEKTIDVAVFDRNSGRMKSNTARVMVLPEELKISLLEDNLECTSGVDCVIHIITNRPFVPADFTNGPVVAALVRSDNSSMEIVNISEEITEYHFTMNLPINGFYFDLYTLSHGYDWTWIWERPNVCPIQPTPTPALILVPIPTPKP